MCRRNSHLRRTDAGRPIKAISLPSLPLWWRRPAAPGFAALAIAWPDGGDPLRPASPRLRSPGLMAATRCARLRRACDRLAW